MTLQSGFSTFRDFLDRVLRGFVNVFDDSGTDWDLHSKFTAGKTECLPMARVLRNTHLHYVAHKSPPTDQILSHLNPVHVFTTCFLKTHFKFNVVCMYRAPYCNVLINQRDAALLMNDLYFPLFGSTCFGPVENKYHS